MIKRGYTLIEMVIVIVLLGIVASIGSIILVTAFQAARTSSTFTDASWQAQRALQRMVSEIREMTSDTDLSISPNTQITFLNPAGNELQYNLAGTTLTRREGSGATPNDIANGVSNLTFTGYDTNYNQTATASDIKCILVKARIAKSVGASSSIQYLKTLVCPRNLE